MFAEFTGAECAGASSPLADVIGQEFAGHANTISSASMETSNVGIPAQGRSPEHAL